MSETTIANVVFIISTQTLFLAVFGYFFLKEKISLRSFIAITLAISGAILMIGDSISRGSLLGNLAALSMPINFFNSSNNSKKTSKFGYGTSNFLCRNFKYYIWLYFI